MEITKNEIDQVEESKSNACKGCGTSNIENCYLYLISYLYKIHTTNTNL